MLFFASSIQMEVLWDFRLELWVDDPDRLSFAIIHLKPKKDFNRPGPLYTL